MSTTQISLRLGGDLPSSEELTQTLGIKPTKFVRRGERVSKKRVQPVDLWILELAEFDTDSTEEERDSQMLQVAITLQKISSNLAILDRTNCNADLYISTIREEDQGGLTLPPELVAATASAGLSIQISILVMLDDYLEPEPGSSLSTTMVVDS
ncbi:DUF4279 domain-containing protein [Scytonema sp. UIC 10036]|uniref:DUF4279 domain-containing protein n=1 Tax=Scytonema sp. UIC 10036 TaxID=2304196 RepID=UPI00140FE815